MKRIVEFRSYKLKPGTGASFHELIANRSAELMRSWGMDVVAFGKSAEDPDAYLVPDRKVVFSEFPTALTHRRLC
jgi:hypothetical protein